MNAFEDHIKRKQDDAMRAVTSTAESDARLNNAAKALAVEIADFAKGRHVEATVSVTEDTVEILIDTRRLAISILPTGGFGIHRGGRYAAGQTRSETEMRDTVAELLGIRS
jgi:hypothetical protein